MPSADFLRRMRGRYGQSHEVSAPKTFGGLSAEPEPRSELSHRIPDSIDDFLSDASIPFAVLTSRELGRDFVLARDEAALGALTGDDRKLPVLYFADCTEARVLGLVGLRALLDAREVLGPAVRLNLCDRDEEIPA